MLLDSRDEPWSAAERLAHRLLRRARMHGWTAKHAITVAGDLYFIAIAFRGAKLVVEIDGRLHEDDPCVCENDRLRQNALVGSGWRVLRFTYLMLVNDDLSPPARIGQLRLDRVSIRGSVCAREPAAMYQGRT